MNRRTRMAMRCGRRLVPSGRRDWVEALLTEAAEVPPGPRRLAWRAGAAWLIARETLMRRGIISAVLFAIAAAVAAWLAWPRSSAGAAMSLDRIYVITMVSVLAVLPLLARPFFGPVGDSRAARLVRAGSYVALLALIPAYTEVRQFDTTPPRTAADLRVYHFVGQPPGPAHQGKDVLLLIVMALYVPVIVWLTSKRSGVAPTTLTVATRFGIAFGIVMYAVAPLGLSKAATNPWLPGSDVDPLVLLAWALLITGPVAAGLVADRRYRASSGSTPPSAARIRQVIAAGLLTSLSGGLFVAVLGTGTIVAMLKMAWLRNWLYHGHHLLSGVQNLSADLKTPAAIAYSHQITGSADMGGLFAICLGFPVIALFFTAFAALAVWEDAPADGESPRPGGGPRRPVPVPGSPQGVRLTDVGTDTLRAGSMAAVRGRLGAAQAGSERRLRT